MGFLWILCRIGPGRAYALPVVPLYCMRGKKLISLAAYLFRLVEVQQAQVRDLKEVLPLVHSVGAAMDAHLTVTL